MWATGIVTALLPSLLIYGPVTLPIGIGLLIMGSPWGVPPLLGGLVVPVAVALSMRYRDHDISFDQHGRYPLRRGDLAPWAWWMATPDERLPGGLYEPSVAHLYGWVKPESLAFYLTSVVWLWRNRCHALKESLRFRPSGIERISVWGPANVGAERGGCAYYRVGRAWNLYLALPLWRGKTSSWGPRVALGWKLQGFVREPRDEWPRLVLTTGTGQWVCSIAPWHRYDF